MSLRCRYTIIYEHTVLVDPTTGRIVQVVDKMQSLGRFLCWGTLLRRYRKSRNTRAATRGWLEERKAELLVAPYFNVIYTLPARSRTSRLKYNPLWEQAIVRLG